MVTTHLAKMSRIASDAGRWATPAARLARRARAPVARRVLRCLIALSVISAVGALPALIVPSLAPATRPHPTLHPTPGAILAILTANARVLGAPFILVVHGSPARERRGARRRDRDRDPRRQRARHRVRDRTLASDPRSLPPASAARYLAASTAASAWIDARERAINATAPDAGVTATYAAATLALLAAAAAVEVLLTPHAR